MIFPFGHGSDQWEKIFGPDWLRSVLTADREVSKRTVHMRDVALEILREEDPDKTDAEGWSRTRNQAKIPYAKMDPLRCACVRTRSSVLRHFPLPPALPTARRHALALISQVQSLP